jgi:hypothetical protein
MKSKLSGEQIPLFDLNSVTSVAAAPPNFTRDPYWDEVVLEAATGQTLVEENGQTTLFYDDTQEPPDPDDYPNLEAFEIAWVDWEKKYPGERLIHPPPYKRAQSEETVREQSEETVREQILLADAPAPEQKHWVESYWVRRGNQKYWYYRYVWMQGRKLHHVHIPGGNVKNRKVRATKEMVENAITLGKSPLEIEELIKGGG